jgi:hypothetical protein
MTDSFTKMSGDMVNLIKDLSDLSTGYGRWSYITFNGKENKHITVINAYRVCSQRDPGDSMQMKS